MRLGNSLRAPPVRRHDDSQTGAAPSGSREVQVRIGRSSGAEVTCRAVGEQTEEVRDFLAREWPAADRAIFGREVAWTSRPVLVEARAAGLLVGVAVGEAVAGMARLHDLLVTPARQGAGVGHALVEAFCARAAELGAARCFLRCPDTDRHRRFYERLGFEPVARLPRYYHGHDFVEYLREPLVQEGRGAR
jgi:GNAT superfamily N-acetyltransferase